MNTPRQDDFLDVIAAEFAHYAALWAIAQAPSDCSDGSIKRRRRRLARLRNSLFNSSAPVSAGDPPRAIEADWLRSLRRCMQAQTETPPARCPFPHPVSRTAILQSLQRN